VQVGGQIAARRVVVRHIMDSDPVVSAQTWRTTHGDMTDEEWELIADLVAPYWKPGGMGRPVTVVTEFPAMLEPVHDKPDAFRFLIHDLEHAHRFFEDPVSHRDQCRLAQALLVDLQAGHFDRYLDDPIFQAKFEYLIADMNTHVAHALHYLRAILVEFHLRQAGSGPAAPLSGEAARDVATRIGILGQIVGLRAELFGCGPQGASAIAGCGMVNSLDGF